MHDTIGNINPQAHSAGLFYIRSDSDFSDPFDDLKNLHFSDDESIESSEDENFQTIHGPFDYIDVRDKENLKKYLDENPSIDSFVTNDFTLESASTSEFEHQPNFVSNDESEEENNMNIQSDAPIEKRLYVRTSQSQKSQLMKLYNEFGDDKSVEWYSDKTAIRINNCRKLLCKIRKGENISEVHQKSGRKRKIDLPTMRLIESTLHDNPFTTCHDLKVMLEKDDISVNRSTIWRYLTNGIEDETGKIFSFKKLTNRGPTSDSEENKKIRYERCKELDQYLKNGFEWVCIDETRFEVGYLKKYGWGERGTRTVNRKKKHGFSGTAITAISSEGFAYCQFVRGSVTSDIFLRFLTKLRKQFPQEADIVIWLDNASIHKAAMKVFPQDEQTKKRLKEEGKRWIPVIFNAAYSPELNPIENVLSDWKRIVEEKITRWNSEEELINLITDAYCTMGRRTIRKSMERVRRVGFKLVSEMKDLNDLRTK